MKAITVVPNFTGPGSRVTLPPPSRTASLKIKRRLLAEALTWWQAVGGGVILAGIVLARRASRVPRAAPTPAT